MSYDPDCGCPYHLAVWALAGALYARPGASLRDVEAWDYYRRMARKVGAVAWARMCSLPPWQRKTLAAWRGLRGACSHD